VLEGQRKGTGMGWGGLPPRAGTPGEDKREKRRSTEEDHTPGSNRRKRDEEGLVEPWKKAGEGKGRLEKTEREEKRGIKRKKSSVTVG